MSKRGSAIAVLAGAAIVVLAGCTGEPRGTAPDVPGQTAASSATGSTSAAPGTGRSPGTPGGQRSANSTAANSTAANSTAANSTAADSTGTPAVSSPGFAKADSIPFPVAVGNTWVYKTTLGTEAGRTTNRIVWTGPGQDGYEVTMSSTGSLPGTEAVQSEYVFYPDGTIGYPVTPVDGVPVSGVVRWPNAAGLASGRPYHPALRGPGGTVDVTVQGEGTAPVSVPAGTFQASVVTMLIPAKAGTLQVTTWIAEGIGPVKTVIQVADTSAPGVASELQSFSKGTSAGIGS
jgi:hypothetical protein